MYKMKLLIEKRNLSNIHNFDISLNSSDTHILSFAAKFSKLPCFQMPCHVVFFIMYRFSSIRVFIPDKEIFELDRKIKTTLKQTIYEFFKI